VEHECERCSEPLKREEHIKCADCADIYVMDMAQEDWSFASEITGQYAVNLDDYVENNDPSV
jgi:hypothetical protein